VPQVAWQRERGSLLVAVLALIGFGLLLAIVRGNRSAAIDTAVTIKLQRGKRPWLDRLMRIVSWPGFPPESQLISGGLPLAIWALGFRVEAVFQGLAYGVSFLSFLTKQVIRRPRPNHPKIEVVAARLGGTSFPSGHVLNYMGVYGFLAFLLNAWVKPAALRRALVGALLSLIALVGPSRIYLGHHYLTDVLASYLLGISYVLGLTALYRRVKAWTRWS
jgi:membrane-associated phospholipid phosphatase